ncbi:MAG: glycosyltransferase [Paludibacteraceae bacterium]|nr:glycosyltransferase [Paludibacteraceae bacterium]
MENGVDFLLRVECMTYNQAPYIKDALDGFCMQQTTFPFLCIIADDASTDGEPEVIKKYLDTNFDKIENALSTEDETDEYLRIYARHKKNLNCYFCVVLFKYNHYSIRKLKVYNIAELVPKIKYMAMCEGDDYWTDPQKLQKQVDFLEEHEEYVLSFHDARTIDAEGNTIAESKMKLYYSEKMCRDWSDFDLMCGYTPFTPTVIYRIEVRAKVGREMYKAKGLINGDTIVASLIGKYGKGKFHADIANSVCRVQRGGIWQMKTDLYKALNSYRMFTFLASVHKKNKKVRDYIFNYRVKLLRNIVRLNIEERNTTGFLHYYFKILVMLFVKFKMRDICEVSKDTVHWFRGRKRGVN